MEGDLTNHLTKTSKGKSKWTGDYSSLQALINETLKLSGKWSFQCVIHIDIARGGTASGDTKHSCTMKVNRHHQTSGSTCSPQSGYYLLHKEERDAAQRDCLNAFMAIAEENHLGELEALKKVHIMFNYL